MPFQTILPFSTPAPPIFSSIVKHNLLTKAKSKPLPLTPQFKRAENVKFVRPNLPPATSCIIFGVILPYVKGQR